MKYCRMTFLKRSAWSFLLAFLFVGGAYAQSVEERIGNALNSQSWHQLRKIYTEEGMHIQKPFLKTLSRFFIAHFYNEPDSAMYYGHSLLEKYQADLGGGVAQVIYLMSDDAARLGLWDDAYQLMHAYNTALAKAQVPAEPLFVSTENQYKALRDAGGFQVIKPAKEMRIPFSYLFGKRKSPGLICLSAKIHGETVQVKYDTGAGANVMSEEMARKLNVKPCDFAGTQVSGVADVNTRFAIVDSVCLGEIVYRNVPFQIIDFSTGNAEADAQLQKIGLHCVLGSQTMMPLGEIQFDFANSCLIIPEKLSAKPAYAPNLYRSAGNMFVLSLYDYKSQSDVDAHLDSGAAYRGLTFKYFDRNRNLFQNMVQTDTLRYAGVGGVGTARIGYTDMRYKVGDRIVTSDSVSVAMDGNIQGEEFDMLYGLPEMTSFDKMILNFKDMWLRME